MAYKRHRGNSGQYERVETPEDAPRPPSHSPPPPPAGPRAPLREKTPPGPPRSSGGGLDGFLSRLGPRQMETEDLLVLAILWLLYRDSGDWEMLIAMGAYAFM